MGEEEFCCGVHCESGCQVLSDRMSIPAQNTKQTKRTHLDIHRITFSKAGFQLMKSVASVSVEDVKMADPILAEEGTGHCTVESGSQD